MRSPLDIEAVEAFVLAVDFRSFTRAAGALNMTQAAVSLRIRRLEERLGRRLLERTPRSVGLTAAGERFLGVARDLVGAGHRAAEAFVERPAHLAIGITHHLVGPNLPALLRRMTERDGATGLHLRVEATRSLLDLYDDGALDAVVVLRHDENRRGGETVARVGFGWFCRADFANPPARPIPIATQPEPCGIRAMAVRALDAAGVRWREAFVGRGAAAVGAAASAGVAIAPLARCAAPADAREAGDEFRLPALPKRDVVLHSRMTGARAGKALRAVAGAFRMD